MGVATPVLFDEAIDLAERYAERDSDDAFRWTMETTAVVQEWLKYASPQDIDRLRALEKAGRIEFTAMFGHLSPLADTAQMMESFAFLDILRQSYGFTIEYAMNCDINGVNYPLADLLLNLGVKGILDGD